MRCAIGVNVKPKHSALIRDHAMLAGRVGRAVRSAGICRAHFRTSHSGGGAREIERAERFDDRRDSRRDHGRVETAPRPRRDRTRRRERIPRDQCIQSHRYTQRVVGGD